MLGGKYEWIKQNETKHKLIDTDSIWSSEGKRGREGRR